MDSIDKLLKTIRTSDEETAKNFLVEHINMLAESLIKNSWNRAQHLLRFQRKNRTNQLRKFTLEQNDFDGSVAYIDLLKFIACIQDFAKEGSEKYTDVKDFTDDLEGLVMEKLGEINPDRRSLFQKQD
jgi:hypothetical protein